MLYNKSVYLIKNNFMQKQIKFYRVILNILFYIFFVLITSIAFSFLFPSIQTLLWYEIWNINDPRFINIQFWIIIVVFIFSFIFRKYLYLPITISKYEGKNKSIDENKNEKAVKKDNKLDDIKISEEINIDINFRDSSNWYIEKEVEKKIIRINNDENINNWKKLDIKIGKEII